MNHFEKFQRTVAIRASLLLVIPGVFSAAMLITSYELTSSLTTAIIAALFVYTISCIIVYRYIFTSTIKPLKMVWQAIWHVSPQKTDVTPPKVDELLFGREMVEAMIMQIYELASSTKQLVNEQNNEVSIEYEKIINSLPLAIFVIDNNQTIKMVNKNASLFTEQDEEKIINRNMHEVLNLSFSTEDTLEKWLSNTDNTITDNHFWENVKLSLPTDKSKRFDISAHYSKNDSSGYELVLGLFEKTNIYSIQEEATSYVALAVHELRTPLTMLRGYIELFEEEIGDQLDDEHKIFMNKMSATSQNLTAIVSNILNISRINENQFNLELQEATWSEVLKEIVSSIELRAQVRNKKLILEVEDNLPTVGIDKISMYEVMVNLIDNAIKYSGQGNEIRIISKLSKDGIVETIVEDKGPGMPANVVSGLFTKFYRSHRSRDTVGGSGLGLYIVKSIISAHGGNVWARSKEGEGSEFGFTLLPYANLKEDQRNGNNDGIVRQANGWIKNHSLYRR